MFRSVVAAALVVLCSLYFLSASRAQEEYRPVTRRPSIGDRLEQFRQDLFGESRPAPKKSPGHSTRASDQRTTSVAPSAGPTQTTPAAREGLVPRSASIAAAPSTAATPLAASLAAESESSAASRPTPARIEPQQPKEAPVAALPSSRRSATRYGNTASAPRRANNPLLDEQLDEPTPADEPKLRAVPSDEEHRPRLARAEAREEVVPHEPAPSVSREPAVHAAETGENEQPEPARPVRPSKAPMAVPGDNVLFSSQGPLLSVEAAGPRKVVVGKEASFAVKIRNAGDTAASNVLVSVRIPSSVEVLGAQPSTGSASGPADSESSEPYEWRLPRLEAHSRETLTIRLIPRSNAPIELGVQWTCQPEATLAQVEVQEPKLAMTLSGPGEVLFGQSKVYKLSISNPGTGEAENVQLLLSPIGKSSEGSASHRVGTLKPGESKTIEVELTARESGQLIIKAQASAEGGLLAEAEENVLVRRAELRVAVEAPKTKFAGTPTTYVVRITNAGNATADGVQLTAVLPPEAKFVSASGGKLTGDHGKVLWNAGSLQAGAERQFEVQCTLKTPGENVLSVTTQGEGELHASANAVTRVEALADLKLEVRDPQGPIPTGEDAIYEVVVRNRGTKAAEKIEGVIYFSEGLEATQVDGGDGRIIAGQVELKPIQRLEPGAEVVVKIHTTAERAGSHIFRAEAYCQPLAVRLAAEQTTLFYGDDAPRVASKAARQPAAETATAPAKTKRK